MAIDGIVILDASGRPLIQSNFRSCPPSYPLLHIDAYNNWPSENKQAQSPDPVIFLQCHSGPAACCHTSYGSLTFLAPVRGDQDPLFAFNFLNSFIDVLKDYFGELSPHSIKDNFDVVYQLLEEMLDDGHPLTMEPNALRDIVIPPSFFNKIMSISGISGLSNTSASPFSSPIPWRKVGARYNNNEIYFDVVEEMNAVVTKNGAVLDSQIWGQIKSHCKLSGTPDLTLSFHNPQHLSNISFHPCVRIPKWVRDKSLSFVPPDGRFVLMSYLHPPQVSNSLSNQFSNVPLPFVLKAASTKSENTTTLDVVVSARMREPVENFVMEFHPGEGSIGVNCVAGVGSTWGFDPKSLTVRWEIPSVLPSSTYTLKGTFTSTTACRPSRSLITYFSLPHRSFSGLKIDQLKIMGELYKPYKGVRGSGTGAIEWRL